MKIKLAASVIITGMFFNTCFLNAQAVTQPDNTRVNKQTPLTEAQKQSIREFKVDVNDKINDLEKRVEKIKTEAAEKNKTQEVAYLRIIDNLERNKEKLKLKIKTFDEITFKKNEQFKKEVNQSFDNLESEYKRLVNELNSPEETIIKKKDD